MEQTINRDRLFLGSCLALTVTSLTFAVRAQIEGVFGADYGLTAQEIGWAFGPAFWGFTIAMFAGGLIIDLVKTKNVIWMAFFMQLIGLVLMLIARDKTMLFVSNVFVGLGNGFVEAAFNPLVATLYPNAKTKMLNRFHVWFPGGIVIGGLLAYLLVDTLGLSWIVLVGTLFIPLVWYGVLFLGQEIPETERVTSGVSYKDMLKNTAAPYTIILIVSVMIAFASIPSLSIDFGSNITYFVVVGFLALIVIEGRVVNKIGLLFPFIFICMFLTASSELGTNQFINALLTDKGVSPILILVMITGIMAVGRFFAGPIIHRLNPTGVLLGSAVLSTIGLYLLSTVSGVGPTLGSAVVFALGICYFWPTMIGFVAEYVPESGALGLSIMGGTGMVATSLILPIMGESIDTAGPQATLGFMTILPAILIVLFAGLYVYMKGKSGSEEAAH
ncbi:MAG: MFS transporter [Balneolaceae bacterium]|nr:MFS transporter [Balneolaceae bacterium]MBO6547433.1 MFS transporter [Balneolaceae bacterium]MBO6647620.1 MFS transporter [Balneolaceae bacterium]